MSNIKISDLQIGDKVVLMRDISGFKTGHKGIVDELYTSGDRKGNPIPAVMVAWDLEDPQSTWNRPTRDGITEEEQTTIGFINKI